jgi:hypothetical protein
MILFFILCFSPRSSSFPAYDCDHPSTEIRMYNLEQPAPCPDPKFDYDSPVKVQTQFLQATSKIPIRATRCLITVTRKATYCGFTSITYPGVYTAFEQQVEITPSECREIVRTKIFSLEQVTTPITIGSPNVVTYFSHGSGTSSGTCTTSSFVRNSVVYSYHYEETILKVWVKEIHGMYYIGINTIKFDNGIKSIYTDLVERDGEEGLLVWDKINLPCHETFSQIYLGEADLHRFRGSDSENAIILVKNNQTDQYAGAIVKGVSSVCGIHGYRTQIPGLHVIILRI